MRYRYGKFDPSQHASDRLRMLRDLFLQLLMHSGGDAERALKWLDEIAERHGLWGDDLDLDKLREDLIDQGLITVERHKGKGDRRNSRFRIQATRKAEKALRKDAFDQIFGELRQDSFGGGHATPHPGSGGERLPETRPFEFGDRVQDIDMTGTLNNAMVRSMGGPFEVTEDDLEVHEVEHTTGCATVIALDISHSMILYGEDRITPAKRVALALIELIQTKYPRDALDCIVFGDEAAVVDPRQIGYIQVGPYHTNTRDALDLAQGLLRRRRHANRQIILITDGKPSALTLPNKQIYINSFGLDARIVNKTIEAAQQCRRHGILITTFMIASDPYLKQFVERLTEANHGRAYYSDLANLGKFVLMDYVKNRRQEI